MARKAPKRAVWVELLMLGSVAFVAVLIVAWVRMPDVQRGVRTVAEDVAVRLGLQQ